MRIPSLSDEEIVLVFWHRVDKQGPDDCWSWKHALNAGGYGCFTLGKRNCGSYLAHRFAWMLAHGPIPEGESYHGTCVLHTCDNRLCCNPAHLWLGTQADNAADMMKKGRGRNGGVCGEAHHNSKLTEEAVRAIRSKYATGTISFTALAKLYGVSNVTVHRIVRYKHWKHIA